MGNPTPSEELLNVTTQEMQKHLDNMLRKAKLILSDRLNYDLGNFDIFHVEIEVPYHNGDIIRVEPYKRILKKSFPMCEINDYRLYPFHCAENKLNYITVEIKFTFKEEDRLEFLKTILPFENGRPIIAFCSVEVQEVWKEYHWNPKENKYEVLDKCFYNPDERSPKEEIFVNKRILSYGRMLRDNAHIPERRFIKFTEKESMKNFKEWDKVRNHCDEIW